MLWQIYVIFAGIDANFYNDYAFKVTNRSENMRNSELHRKYRDFAISTATVDP